MRLALAIGKWPREVLAENDARDIAEWMAFYRLEPFGDEWRQTGRIVAKVHNASGNYQHPADEEEFMPLPRSDEEQDAEEAKAFFRASIGA